MKIHILLLLLCITNSIISQENEKHEHTDAVYDLLIDLTNALFTNNMTLLNTLFDNSFFVATCGPKTYNKIEYLKGIETLSKNIGNGSVSEFFDMRISYLNDSSIAGELDLLAEMVLPGNLSLYSFYRVEKKDPNGKFVFKVEAPVKC